MSSCKQIVLVYAGTGTGTGADTDTDTDTATGIGTGTGTDTDTGLKASQEALEGSQKELKRRGGAYPERLRKRAAGDTPFGAPRKAPEGPQKAHLGAKKTPQAALGDSKANNARC